MKTAKKPVNPKRRSIPVEQLRAGDTVELDSEDALVVMVEKADPQHVLVAYENRDEIEYSPGATLCLKARSHGSTE